MRKNRNIENRIQTICEQQTGDLIKTEPILVAVSGGTDSISLLHILNEIGFKKIIILHFNHQLRGLSSSMDALFVKKIADNLGFPFVYGHSNIIRESCRHKLSVETMSRKARYEFFAQSTVRWKTNTIFLAHHADDQLETIIFRFLRGTHRSGLSGMRPESQQSIGDIQLTVKRPLLTCWKSDIIDYLDKKSIQYREDSSNKLAECSRNKIRLQLIPFIENLFGPTFKRTILRNAELFADEENFFHTLIQPYSASKTVLVQDIRSLHRSLQRRILYNWLINQGQTEISSTQIEQMLSLLYMGSPAKINCPNNRHVRRRLGKIFLE